VKGPAGECMGERNDQSSPVLLPDNMCDIALCGAQKSRGIRQGHLHQGVSSPRESLTRPFGLEVELP
jgi:hypothetical protein